MNTMYIRELFLFAFITILASFNIHAQDVISFYNPSFEDSPQHSKTVKGWQDCGFINESPPDVQPGSWEVSLRAQHGNTYLGMVTRDNDTWERVSQRLPKPLEGDNCYKISLYLAAFEEYISASKLTGRISNYNAPTVLRIWGGNYSCDQGQLLAESQPVNHSDWEKYTFRLEPEADYQYIMLEAYYDVPVLIPTNGNLLVDNMSEIVEIPCDDSGLIAVQEVEEKAVVDTPRPTVKKVKKEIEQEEENTVADVPVENEQILKGLDHDKLEKGQLLRIENLYFDTDSSSVTEKSIPVLNEIYTFLKKHEDVKIEIGGHTNGLPPEFYCKQLSEQRAKAVADYLINLGIDDTRISYKGYGKENLIADDNTMEGREKNQRCEIKIVSIGEEGR